MLKFLAFELDDINHSNFEYMQTNVLINHDVYLLKHVCFIIKLKDICDTCVHFQWKETSAGQHSQDTASAAHV